MLPLTLAFIVIVPSLLIAFDITIYTKENPWLIQAKPPPILSFDKTDIGL